MKISKHLPILTFILAMFAGASVWAQAPCSTALRTKEMTPIRTGEACDGTTGNYLERTVCNSAGFQEYAISLPAGRKASCFQIVAQRTPNKWKIIDESTGATVYSPVIPGAPKLVHLVLDGGTTGKTFRLMLDPASAPGAFVKLSFVDHP